MPEHVSKIAASVSSGSSHDSVSCKDEAKVRLSINLVAAARWHLSFLQSFSDSVFTHRRAALRESIRRYAELWMPLMSELSKNSQTTPMLLPPADVACVWHCHVLRPSLYRNFCLSRFGSVVERPIIFDEGNEEYASHRCRAIWAVHFPSETFDLEIYDVKDEEEEEEKDGILAAINEFDDLCKLFLDPFVGQTVYLVSARQKYRNFLHLCRKHGDKGRRLVPTSDVLLMWLTHQSFPGVYARDMEEFMGERKLESIAVGFGEKTDKEEVEETVRVWERAFDEPYEQAGVRLGRAGSPLRECFYWAYWASDSETNRKYKSLLPRSLMEVQVFVKGGWGETDLFFRVRTVRFHRRMKLVRPVSSSSSSWEKAWEFCCEFGTRGLVLDLRGRGGGGCFLKRKPIKESLIITWNEILRAPSLAVMKDLGSKMKAMISITPPVQAPYLLKIVPDRVTDDGGAMISDEILRMNQYCPQSGRWLSRSVLDCYGRECFVVRLRVGEGFWRRGAEAPRLVKKEERVIEVREGPWSYVASSIGKVPQRVVGSASPKEEEEKTATWVLSTGELLRIRWQSGLEFNVESENSLEKMRIEVGRKLQYKVKKTAPDEEEEFVTFIRYLPEFPEGRATALFNWRRLAVELLPEEDAVFVLIVCMAIVLAVTEMKTEDVAHLLVRRRVKEAMAGARDWESVMLPPLPSSSLSSSSSSSSSSVGLLRPWFWNPKEVFSTVAMEDAARPGYRYSPADGKDEIYRQALALSRETVVRHGW
ncbi:enolase (DUF1399) [Wolffia australiana]